MRSPEAFVTDFTNLTSSLRFLIVPTTSAKAAGNRMFSAKELTP